MQGIANKIKILIYNHLKIHLDEYLTSSFFL